MIETTVPADLIVPRHRDSTRSKTPGPAPTRWRRSCGVPDHAGGTAAETRRRAEMAEALAHAEPFNRFPGLIREVIDSECPRSYDHAQPDRHGAHPGPGADPAAGPARTHDAKLVEIAQTAAAMLRRPRPASSR